MQFSKATRPLQRGAVWPFFMPFTFTLDSWRELLSPSITSGFLNARRRGRDGADFPSGGAHPHLVNQEDSQHRAALWRYVACETLRRCRPSCFLMSTDSSSPPEGFRETMQENNWTEQEKRAWEVLHEAIEGDYVLWADRKTAMEVVDTGQDDEGRHYLDVAKPRADGTYRVREGYDDGEPQFTSPIGSANNLHFVEKTERPRGLDESEYNALVRRLSENAQDAFLRMDYENWDAAVADVVDDWAEEVSFHEWRGYRHHPDWQDGDAEAIFESVVDHADYEGYDEDDTIRTKAEVALHDAVFREGRQQAEANIITSAADYEETVETLAHHALDRYDRKSYTTARVAVRDTVSDWIDDRHGTVYQAIIQYGDNRFEDDDYSDLSPDEEARERAFDILDHDVWELAQEMQRDRGEHDPTVRGLTRRHYDELVDALVEEALKRYDGSGLLRSTVADVVEDWADAVEAEQWDGHRHRVWAAGDVDDIFSSVVIHADNDPFVFNPFSRHKERKMAVSALTPEVLRATETAIDERGEPMPAHEVNDFIQNNIGADISFEEIHAAEQEEVEQFFERVLDSVEGNEVGWTFVEEIIEAGGSVPESTNDWSLVDYGVVRADSNVRKLAWFNRETGELLVLSGVADEEAEGLPVWTDETPFHVQRIEFGGMEPEFLLRDAPLEEALDFCRDYIGEDHADLRIIETEDDIYVHDGMSDDDINAAGVIDALVPNASIDLDDLKTITGQGLQSTGRVIRSYWTELTGVAALAALASGHWYLSAGLLGTNLRPNIHKRKGVGLKGAKTIGASKSEPGVGGEIETEIYVRNQTFRNLAEDHAPRFIRYGLNEGDIGKGVLQRAGEGLEMVRGAYAYEEAPAGVMEIRAANLDALSEEEVRDLARRAERDFESEDAWDDIDELRRKMYGWAEHQDVETISWGQAFLDEYGGSVERLEDIFRRGTVDAVEEELAEAEPDEPDPEGQSAGTVADIGDGISDLIGTDPADEYDAEDFSWADLRKTEVGISGIMLRGLEAEDVVAGAEFLDVEGWLEDSIDRAATFARGATEESVQSFEEWQQSRYGPGQPGGPEEEARRLARYHKEVAGNESAPNPYEALNVSEETAQDIEDLGDWDISQYDEEFGNDFEEVAERYYTDEPVESDHEFQQGHE